MSALTRLLWFEFGLQSINNAFCNTWPHQVVNLPTKRDLPVHESPWGSIIIHRSGIIAEWLPKGHFCHYILIVLGVHVAASFPLGSVVPREHQSFWLPCPSVDLECPRGRVLHTSTNCPLGNLAVPHDLLTRGPFQINQISPSPPPPSRIIFDSSEQ